MSLDKAIEHGKEHRKPYRESERFDRSCRNHGKCGYCEGNRKHNEEKKKCACKAQLDDLDSEHGTQKENSHRNREESSSESASN